MRSRRVMMAASALTVALLAGLVQMATASAGLRSPNALTQPYCGITWGSLAKVSDQYTGAPVVGARAGQHDCWDRLVIDLGGKPAAGYRVSYVDGFHAEGSGDPLSVSGGAILRVVALAPAYNEYGQPTVPWRVGDHVLSFGGFQTFRDLVYGGTFEGQTSLGLGVRARLPFRVFQLDGPDYGSRLVIDVAHRW